MNRSAITQAETDERETSGANLAKAVRQHFSFTRPAIVQGEAIQSTIFVSSRMINSI